MKSLSFVALTTLFVMVTMSEKAWGHDFCHDYDMEMCMRLSSLCELPPFCQKPSPWTWESVDVIHRIHKVWSDAWYKRGSLYTFGTSFEVKYRLCI